MPSLDSLFAWMLSQNCNKTFYYLFPKPLCHGSLFQKCIESKNKGNRKFKWKCRFKSIRSNAIKNVKKQTKGKIPVGVGFGVSTPDDVKRYIKAGADGVIVGSAYLKLIDKTPQNKLESKIASFTKSLKKQTLQKK